MKIKKRQVLYLLAKNIQNEVDTYFENQDIYSDVPCKRFEFKMSGVSIDYSSAVYDYYAVNGHLPVFSATWSVNSHGSFLFRGYAIISPHNINQVTENLIYDNQKKISCDELIYIANYYLGTEVFQCFQISKTDYSEFPFPFINTKQFYTPYPKN